jgi:hypothetical protein
VDINKPIENFQLLEKLERLKTNNDSQSEYEFFEELMASKLLSPVTEDSLMGVRGGEAVLEKGEKIKFIYLSDEKGNNYIPAFTDWNEFKKWNDSTSIKALILSFLDYKALITEGNNLPHGFVLNPFGDNIVFDKNLAQEVENCVNNIEKERTVMLGVPEKYPDEMVNALTKFLPTLSVVKRAYLLWMVQGDDDSSFLLVIDTTGDYGTIFGKIADVATKYLGADEKLDFVPASEEFGESAIRGHHPFYEI